MLLRALCNGVLAQEHGFAAQEGFESLFVAPVGVGDFVKPSLPVQLLVGVAFCDFFEGLRQRPVVCLLLAAHLFDLREVVSQLLVIALRIGQTQNLLPQHGFNLINLLHKRVQKSFVLLELGALSIELLALGFWLGLLSQA